MVNIAQMKRHDGVEPYCKEVGYYDFIVNHKLNDETLAKMIEIQDEVFQSKENPHQPTLAGNIEHEYQLSEEQEKVIIPTNCKNSFETFQ